MKKSLNWHQIKINVTMDYERFLYYANYAMQLIDDEEPVIAETLDNDRLKAEIARSIISKIIREDFENIKGKVDLVQKAFVKYNEFIRNLPPERKQYAYLLK